MRAASFLLAWWIVMLVPGKASAGEVLFVLKGPNGAPVRDAVVTLYPAGRPAPIAAPQRIYQISQRNLQFTPFVLVVPVGAQVAFPNLDPVRHHVYSFSPAKRFELKLYAKEQSRAVRFDKPGAVPIGCNIHDQMSAFVKVVDTGLAGQSDASGRVLLGNVPAGPMIARIWHPYLRAPGNQIEMRWPQGAGRQLQSLTLRLRAPPPASAY